MFYKYDIDQIFKEHFDISDKATRKYLVSLDEDEKSAVATALASALYDKIVKKVDEIDFGSIPKSMGDITKVNGFDNTMECLDIIKRLVLEYKQSPEVVDIVINAVENIKARKSTFMKGFTIKAGIVTNLYNLIVLSIEHSVSFLISVCIEYIKNSDTKTIDLALDKVAYNNAHDNLLFEQLDVFNKSCGSGELDSCFAELFKVKNVKEDSEICISAEKPEDVCPAYVPTPDSDGSELFSGEFDDNQPQNIEPIIPEETDGEETKCNEEDTYESDDEIDYDFEEDDIKPAFETPIVTNEIAGEALLGIALGALIGVVAIKSAVYIVKVLIPKMRNMTYFFIHTRVKISDSLAIQAQLIELNAYKVQYNDDIDSAKRDKIVSKQLKVADKLKKWSNKFAIDNKKAEKDAKNDINTDNKTTNIEDIKDQLPDGGDVLF